MKKKNNKRTITIASVIIIVLIAITIVLKCISVENTSFIVIDDYVIQYNGNSITKANIDDIKKMKFRMIQDYHYIGNYTFDHKDESNNRLFFKNEDGVNAIMYPLIGLDDNTSFIDFEFEKMNDDDFNTYKLLTSQNINYELKDLTYSTKITLDNITIYCIKYEGESEKDDYSMLFVKTANNTIILDEDYPQREENGYIFYSFVPMYIIDINNDDKYELVVAKHYYDVTDYSIYELEGQFSELFYTGG